MTQRKSVMMDILRIIGESHRAGVPITYICTKSGLPQSTVYRWVNIMIDDNLILRHPKSKRLHLGDTVFNLGVQAIGNPFINNELNRLLDKFSKNHRCYVHLARRASDFSVLQKTYNNFKKHKHKTSNVASMRILGLSSGGICLLGMLNDYQIKHFFNRNKNTIENAGRSESDIWDRIYEFRTNGIYKGRSSLTPNNIAIATAFIWNKNLYSISSIFTPKKLNYKNSDIINELIKIKEKLSTID